MYAIRCRRLQDAEATRRAFECVGFPYKAARSPNLRNAAQFTCTSDPSRTLRRFGLRVWGEQYELRSEVKWTLG